MTPSIPDKLTDREVSLFSILAKTKESDKWGPASSEDLLAIIGRQGGLPATWSLPAVSPAFTT